MSTPKRVLPNLRPDNTFNFAEAGLHDPELVRRNFDFLTLGSMHSATLAVLSKQATIDMDISSGDERFETPDRWFHRHLEDLLGFFIGYGQFFL